MNDQDVTAVLERVIGPLEDEMGSWDDVLRRAEPRPEGLDDVLHPAGAEHRRGRWTFPRWRIVAVGAAILVGGLLVTPALGIGTSLLDLLKGGPQGEPPHLLTAIGGPSFWSPDGKIVFERRIGTPKNGEYQAYVMNPDGSGKRALLELGDGSFSWSPDGRMIAFRRQDGQVYVVNADGSGARRLTSRPGSWSVGAWSPDGGKLTLTAFARANVGIYVMNADGSGRRRLTRGFAPAWSPDGRKIAYSSVRPGNSGNSEVFVMNADGSANRRLTPQPAGGHSPDWSPDGRKLMFPSRRDGNWEVYVMNPDGSGKRNLTRNPGNDGFQGWGAAWSPDGRKITFVSDRDGTYEVYVMNADGSGQRRLTHRGS